MAEQHVWGGQRATDWVRKSSEQGGTRRSPHRPVTDILEWALDFHRNWRFESSLKRYQRSGRYRGYQVNNRSDDYCLYTRCQVFCWIFYTSYKVRYHPYLNSYCLSFPHIFYYCIVLIYVIVQPNLCLYTYLFTWVSLGHACAQVFSMISHRTANSTKTDVTLVILPKV